MLGFRRLARHSLTGVALGVALLGALGCPVDGDAHGGAPYLIVGEASRQADATGALRTIILQQSGGKYLRMRVEHGALSFTGNANGATQQTACIPAPSDDIHFYFSVRRDDDTAMLYVDLLPSVPVPATSGQGGAPSFMEQCPGNPIWNSILPLGPSTNYYPEKEAGAGGSTGSTSSTSTSTSSTGNTGGGGGSTGGTTGSGGGSSTGSTTGTGGAGGGK